VVLNFIEREYATKGVIEAWGAFTDILEKLSEVTLDSQLSGKGIGVVKILRSELQKAANQIVRAEITC
jgi:hypothetical protein